MELEFEITLHLRNNIPQAQDEKFHVGDEEIDVMVKVDYEEFVPGRFTGPPEDCYPDEGGGHEVLSILRDMSGDGDWEEINSDTLPDSVESYIGDCVNDELKKLDERDEHARDNRRGRRRRR